MEYANRIKALTTILDEQKKKKRQTSTQRLLVIAGILAICWLFWQDFRAATIAGTAILIAIFIRLVYKAGNIQTGIENTERLIAINRNEIAIADGRYTQLPGGDDFKPATHDYCHDLDILGKASVYQYLNRTTSQQGNERFADWLLNPATAVEIEARQQAAAELAPQLEWRQQLQAHGLEAQVTRLTEQKIVEWLKMGNSFSISPRWKIARWLYPAITFSILLLYSIDILPAPWFFASLPLMLAISAWVSKEIHPQYSMLNKIVPEMGVMANSAAWIEKGELRAPLNQQLQKSFTDPSASSAAIKMLRDILDRFDYRLNPLVFIPLNSFVLWDLQLIFQLEHWRKANQQKVADWFSSLATLEALYSIANARFNHPDWATPQLETGTDGVLEAKDLGHPLIPASSRVNNDFVTSGTPKLALITGSNMAGKSTFLRSVGVNMVLAMMGSAVCASRFRLSPMKVISSMRVSDNLEENTSTFYAELKKLKYIIEAVNRKEKVFLLLDEILRGTNSFDRHTGSEALIQQLIKQQAVGIVATHDVELAKLKDQFKDAIDNFHFDARIENEELYFDYQLKGGVCQSLNASLLMKKIGIEINAT